MDASAVIFVSSALTTGLISGGWRSQKMARFGFRVTELVQNRLPGGRSFFFRINGIPVPVKGSNWIPADAFESRITEQHLRRLFHGMAESHQNMIRNW